MEDEGELLRRKTSIEVRGYYDELGARAVDEGQLVGRKTSPQARGYDELDVRAIGEENQLQERKVPNWLKKVGGFFKNTFNKVKDAASNLLGGGGSSSG